MYEPGLDVVVVNYRTENDLFRFIDSYKFQSSQVKSNLIIIDVDAIDNDYQDRIAALDIPGMQYWPTDGNTGYARACNFGSTVSNSEVIACFNADTVLYDKTLDECYNALMSEPTWGVVGPLQVNRDGLVTHAGIFGSNMEPKHRAWMQPVNDTYKDVKEAVSVSGSAYFVKRELWDTITNDPVYRRDFPNAEGAMLPVFLYYEETFISYMARYFGYKVIYLGTSIMEHDWHRSIAKNPVGNHVMSESQKVFRDTLDLYGIPHD